MEIKNFTASFSSGRAKILTAIFAVFVVVCAVAIMSQMQMFNGKDIIFAAPFKGDGVTGDYVTPVSEGLACSSSFVGRLYCNPEHTKLIECQSSKRLNFREDCSSQNKICQCTADYVCACAGSSGAVPSEPEAEELPTGTGEVKQLVFKDNPGATCVYSSGKPRGANDECTGNTYCFSSSLIVPTSGTAAGRCEIGCAIHDDAGNILDYYKLGQTTCKKSGTKLAQSAYGTLMPDGVYECRKISAGEGALTRSWTGAVWNEGRRSAGTGDHYYFEMKNNCLSCEENTASAKGRAECKNNPDNSKCDNIKSKIKNQFSNYVAETNQCRNSNNKGIFDTWEEYYYNCYRGSDGNGGVRGKYKNAFSEDGVLSGDSGIIKVFERLAYPGGWRYGAKTMIETQGTLNFPNQTQVIGDNDVLCDFNATDGAGHSISKECNVTLTGMNNYHCVGGASTFMSNPFKGTSGGRQYQCVQVDIGGGVSCGIYNWVRNQSYVPCNSGRADQFGIGQYFREDSSGKPAYGWGKGADLNGCEYVSFASAFGTPPKGSDSKAASSYSYYEMRVPTGYCYGKNQAQVEGSAVCRAKLGPTVAQTETPLAEQAQAIAFECGQQNYINANVSGSQTSFMLFDKLACESVQAALDNRKMTDAEIAECKRKFDECSGSPAMAQCFSSSRNRSFVSGESICGKCGYEGTSSLKEGVCSCNEKGQWVLRDECLKAGCADQQDRDEKFTAQCVDQGAAQGQCPSTCINNSDCAGCGTGWGCANSQCVAGCVGRSGAWFAPGAYCNSADSKKLDNCFGIGSPKEQFVGGWGGSVICTSYCDKNAAPNRCAEAKLTFKCDESTGQVAVTDGSGEKSFIGRAEDCDQLNLATASEKTACKQQFPCGKEEATPGTETGECRLLNVNPGTPGTSNSKCKNSSGFGVYVPFTLNSQGDCSKANITCTVVSDYDRGEWSGIKGSSVGNSSNWYACAYPSSRSSSDSRGAKGTNPDRLRFTITCKLSGGNEVNADTSCPFPGTDDSAFTREEDKAQEEQKSKEGGVCETDDDCQEGLVCVDKKCVKKEDAEKDKQKKEEQEKQDATAPQVNISSPTGTINTKTAQLSVTTDIPANCKYMLNQEGGLSAGNFDGAGMVLSGTGGTSHNATLSNLTNIQAANCKYNHAVTVLCKNSKASAGATSAIGSAQTNFSVDLSQDSSNAPVVVAVMEPKYTIANPVLKVTTDRPADCEYKKDSDFSFGGGTKFDTTGSYAHNTQLNDLANADHTYYVVCQDKTTCAANKPGASVKFKVDLSDDPANAPNIVNTTPETQTVANPTLSVTTDRPAACQYKKDAAFTYDGGTQFSNDGEYAHSVSLADLPDGKHTFYVACKDKATGAKKTLETAIVTTLNRGGTAGAPVISNTTPPSQNTNSPTLSVITKPAATCQYQKDADFVYGQGIQFTIDGGTGHSAVLSNIPDGLHTYYVVCQDPATQAFNSPGAQIIFTINTASEVCASLSSNDKQSDNERDYSDEDDYNSTYIWRSVAAGTVENFEKVDWHAGYQFTPEKDGTVTQLCGYFDNGARNRVSLYDGGYEELAGVEIDGQGGWNCANIPPVKVKADRRYYVIARVQDDSIYFAYKSGLLPRDAENAVVESGVRQLASTGEFGEELKKYDYILFGLVDAKIKFGQEGSRGPEISNPLPDGNREKSDAVLSAATNEDATCKFDREDLEYKNMKYTFGATGQKLHQQKVCNLDDGPFTWYVRCKSAADTNDGSTPIQFKVDD